MQWHVFWKKIGHSTLHVLPKQEIHCSPVWVKPISRSLSRVLSVNMALTWRYANHVFLTSKPSAKKRKPTVAINDKAADMGNSAMCGWKLSHYHAMANRPSSLRTVLWVASYQDSLSLASKKAFAIRSSAASSQAIPCSM